MPWQLLLVGWPKLTKFRMCGRNNLYLLWFSRYFTFKFWWRHNDVITEIILFHMVQYMHKLTRFYMCVHNNLYRIWCSSYLTYKFWWRHNDVITEVWNFSYYGPIHAQTNTVSYVWPQSSISCMVLSLFHF